MSASGGSSSSTTFSPTLGAELAQAKSRDEIRAKVLGKSAEIFGSELSILALLDPSLGRDPVHVREGRRTRELPIKLAGRGRFASARLSGEAAPEDSVFAAWAQDLGQELGAQLGVVSHMAAPLRTPTGILGGLFVAWRSAITRFSPEQQRLLGVVAGTAGASLGNLQARAETDHSLRAAARRARGLGAPGRADHRPYRGRPDPRGGARGGPGPRRPGRGRLRRARGGPLDGQPHRRARRRPPPPS